MRNRRPYPYVTSTSLSLLLTAHGIPKPKGAKKRCARTKAARKEGVARARRPPRYASSRSFFDGDRERASAAFIDVGSRRRASEGPDPLQRQINIYLAE